MSPKFLINRMEMSFWNIVIPLMHQSHPVRMAMAWSYKIACKLPSPQAILLGLMSILAGGLLGYLLGILNQFR